LSPGRSGTAGSQTKLTSTTYQVWASVDEIAAEMRVPLATVRKRLAELSAAGDVVMCQLTRYEGSKTIEAWQCRVSGYVPAPAPGRKPKAA
jgi:predicted ArsR family transcriptional regulator